MAWARQSHLLGAHTTRPRILVPRLFVACRLLARGCRPADGHAAEYGRLPCVAGTANGPGTPGRARQCARRLLAGCNICHLHLALCAPALVPVRAAGAQVAGPKYLLSLCLLVCHVRVRKTRRRAAILVDVLQGTVRSCNTPRERDITVILGHSSHIAVAV